MKKIIRRTVAGSLLFGLMAISGLVTLIFLPQGLFAEKLVYEHFIVYHGQDFEVEQKKLQPILDNAYRLIARAELHNPNYKFRIFFAHNHVFNQIEGLQGGDVLARATAGNIVVKVEPDIETTGSIQNIVP